MLYHMDLPQRSLHTLVATSAAEYVRQALRLLREPHSSNARSGENDGLEARFSNGDSD